MKITVRDIKRATDIMDQCLKEAATVTSETQRSQILRKGFVATCNLLKDILKSDFFDEYEKLINSMQPDGAATLAQLASGHPALQLLQNPKEFREFLTFERDLLTKAGLNENEAERIVNEVKDSFDSLFEQDFTRGNFEATVSMFKDYVCGNVPKNTGVGRKVLFFLGGLSLIAVDAAAAPVSAGIPIALSTALGGGLAGQGLAGMAERR